MARIDWNKDRERKQMGNAEEAFPKEKKKRGPDDKPVPIAPRPPLPAWMRDKKLLPKKPPGQAVD